MDDVPPLPPLSARWAARLAPAEPTPPPSTRGLTLRAPSAAPTPPGYAALRESAVIGRGGDDLARARIGLADWQVQRRAGVRVRADGPADAVGSTAVLGLGAGPVRLSAPVRVVGAVDEPHRAGFAYATLPGHPEDGEESFVLTLDDDERVRLTVSAFSRHAAALLRLTSPLSAPVAGLVQRRVTARYLRSLLA